MAYPYPIKIGTGISASANYPSNAGIEWEGGDGTMLLGGTFTAATAKLQCKSPLSSTWIDIPDASFTANGAKAFNLADKVMVRLNVADASGDSIDCYLHYNTKS